MTQKEENLDALMSLVNKIDAVQIEIESLYSLMDFNDTEKEEEISVDKIINRFSEVYKSNRDKFVLKIISILESME